MNNIGDLIKQYRKEKGLSQLDLSLKVGWENPSTLSRIEKGVVNPSRETLIRLSQSLDLELTVLNHILRVCNYVEYEPEINAEYKNHVINTIKEEWDTYSYPMVLLQSAPANTIYWNKATVYFFLGKKNSFLSKKMLGKTHIELLFLPEYGIRERIMNWNEFSRIVARNAYIWEIQRGSENNFIESLNIWMKIEEFKNIWCKFKKNKDNYNNELIFNIPFIYNHPDIGVLNMTLSTFLYYEDTRFLIEQFSPNKNEDLLKLQEYMKTI